MSLEPADEAWEALPDDHLPVRCTRGAVRYLAERANCDVVFEDDGTATLTERPWEFHQYMASHPDEEL